MTRQTITPTLQVRALRASKTSKRFLGRTISPVAFALAAMGIGSALLPIGADLSVAPAHAQTAGEQPLSGIEKFANYDANSNFSINYGQVDEFIETFSTKSRGRLKFRYDFIRQAGLPYLNRYIDYIAARDPVTFSKNEQLAYWLNLRNLLIIKMISEDDPGGALREERGDFANPGPEWAEKIITVSGVDLSLDDIERGILTKNWSNENLIYGLFQGMRGGTPYPAQSFSGKSVNEQLQQRGSEFINGRSNFSVKKTTIKAPGIYEWYRDDFFGGNDDAIITHVKSHATGKLENKLADATSIEFKKVSYRLDREVTRSNNNLGAGGGGGVGIGAGGAGGGGGSSGS